METAKKYKWALGGLAIMILLNALIIITLWVDRPGMHERRAERGPGDRREAVHNYMSRELNLSEDQIEQMARLRREHFDEMRSLRNSLENTRKAYFDLMMDAEGSDDIRKDSLHAQLTQQYITIEESMYAHMAQMKALLDPSQQEKFGDLMKDMFLRNQSEGRDMPRMRRR